MRSREQNRSLSAAGVLAGLALWLIPAQLLAQLIVTDVIYTFRAAEKPVHNVKVKNSGKEAIYVSVEVNQVTRAGFPDEQRIQSKDLIASPHRFSLAPDADRTVRLLLRKPLVDTEAVYRVRFVPQARPFELEEARGAVKQMGLRVLTGIGMLIFVEPKKPQAGLQWERTGAAIHFKNTGNVNIYLADPRACSDMSLSSPKTGLQGVECEKLRTFGRLYPENERTIKVPAGKTVVISKRVGEVQEEVIIPPT